MASAIHCEKTSSYQPIINEDPCDLNVAEPVHRSAKKLKTLNTRFPKKAPQKTLSFWTYLGSFLRTLGTIGMVATTVAIVAIALFSLTLFALMSTADIVYQIRQLFFAS